jgi:chemotaxis family two-component system response regulator Rcp1
MKAMQMLLVEDSASDIRLVREALKETGVPVQLTIKRDGEEALQYLRQAEKGRANWPDLVLLDLNLPRRNGREVLAEVKSAPGLRQIPVLVMTSSQSDDDVNDCYALNANGYITKPSDLNDYIDVLRAIENFWFFTARLPEPAAPFHNGSGLGPVKQNSFAAVAH